MNYIKQFNQWMDLVSLDDRITPHHISIYLALFQFWNKSRFRKKIIICRHEVLQLSKIGSTKTYYKCLHQLHEYGYIQYFPSHNPLKGSTIIMRDLCEFDLYAMIEPEESSDNSSIESNERPVENIPKSIVDTEVRDKQNSHITCSKNDSSASQVVTPLLINNINLINYKHRERRARTRNNFNNLKKYRENDCQERKALSSGLPSDEGGISKPVSGSSSRNCLERKKIVPRDISTPTLEEVTNFFTEQLSKNYLNNIIGFNDRAMEAEKFFNHYESNGWLLGGKVPMRNWKASCRSWVAKIPYFSRFKQKRSAYDLLHAKPLSNYAVPL